MVVPKIAMRYLASSVAIIKQGDRQLKFVKIKKYNNKYFCVSDSGIYELDDQYEYRYFKTGVYFYNFNNSKPLSLSGMQEVDEKLKDVGDSMLFNKERHVENMMAMNPDSTPDPLEMPPDRTEEMSPDTKRFLQDYQTDDEFGKTNLMVNVHMQKRSVPVFSPGLIPMGVNKGNMAIIQISHRRIDIVPMALHDNQAYTPYGVFEVTRDNMYMVKKQVISFFVLSEKEDKPAKKLPKGATNTMFKLARKKKWGRLSTFNKPMKKHFKEKPNEKKPQAKNLSLSSEKTLMQFKADDPLIFKTTVKELHESKKAVAEKLSDPLKKVIPIALIFGGVMGLMIVMSNAPMVIDKIAEVMGITPPKIVYLSPNEARELGLDVDSLPLAPNDEVSRDQWCKNNPKECRLQGEALLEKQNDLAISMFGQSYRLLSADEKKEIEMICNFDGCGEVETDEAGNPTMTQEGVDEIPPVLVMPDDIFEQADTRGAVIVRYSVYATDNSGTDIEVICEPKSGNIFEVGEHMVKCTALDPSGNMAMGEFMITVFGEEVDRSLVPEINMP